MCPVSWLEYYLSVCSLLDIDLSQGYFFRTTDRGRGISYRPFLCSAVNNRLRKYLTEAKIDSGETPHSLRVGLSNTLYMMGCSRDEISQYLGLKSSGMVRRYLRMSETGSSSSFSQNIQLDSTRSFGQTPVSHPDNLQCVFSP